jgi:hypothetical protein
MSSIFPRRTNPPRSVGGACGAVAASLLVLLGAPLGAQTAPPVDSAKLSADSLAARLARAEAAIALLRQQLASEAQTAVHARSRVQMELTGRLITNAFSSSGRVNSVDVPQFVLPDVIAPAGDRALGLSLRQSRLGAVVSVDDVLGATFDGAIDMDFFGGTSAGAGDRRLFPEPRMRTAHARLRWTSTELMIGSETPLVSDLNPVSIAAVGVPGFVTAGNLWNWLPQLRLTRELFAVPVADASVRWAVQGAVLEPFTSTQPPGDPDAADAGERSGRPFLEARLRARWGEEVEPSDVSIAPGGEIGVGVHDGRVRALATPRDGQVSRALTADWRFAIGRFAELRGEAYTGRLVRGLGGGGIGQNYGRAVAPALLGPAVRDVAGWTQINVQPTPVLIAGAGCGVDRANGDDSPVRERNVSCAAHLLWRPVQPLVAGLEFRRMSTRYTDRSFRANHVNLAFGFEL